MAVLTTATSVAWVPELLPDLAATIGLVLVAAALARELWPREPWAPPLAALATVLIPVVFRMGLVFHPDPVFSVLAALALLLAVRAHRRGWTLAAGAASGALLGLAALTRQSAVVCVVAIGLIALLLGRRRALRFLAAGAVALALVAGPWWGYQTARSGNPIQSYLDRPGIMLDHQPLSFYVGVHGDEVVTNPWRTLNRNELFPKFHVALWSDWSGTGNFGGPYGGNAKSLASSQSVLGFGGDALVLGGLALLGVPALMRVLRRRPLRDADAGLAALSVFFAVAWVAYVVMLIRFPQRDGDPNYPHYLLFLAPACAVLGLAAARELWSRGGWRRAAVAGWTVLYTASWAMVLALML
jgi:4-amino-4-deoxy-L-arabinose transferase-like glycosyltransferase